MKERSVTILAMVAVVVFFGNDVTIGLPQYKIIDLGPGHVAYGLNELGQVVGFTKERHPFIYKNGTITDLGFEGVARSINNRSEVVGWRIDDSGQSHAFVYSDSTISYLPFPATTGPGSLVPFPLTEFRVFKPLFFKMLCANSILCT
jgi:probable HAF family extracellular repeat protein